MFARTFSAVVLAAAMSLPAAGADSLAWPEDFDEKLAARIESLKPSGGQLDDSSTSVFDAVFASDGFAYLADSLRNYAKPGFLLFLR